jgi:hypothetical protein
MKIKTLLWQKLLPSILGCSCGERIPRSGAAGQKVDCFSVYLNNHNGDSIMLVESIGRHQISGLRLDQHKRFSLHDYFPMMNAINLNVEIIHFYRLHEFTYTSMYSYVLRSFTGWDRLRAILNDFFDSVLMWLFNRRKLEAGKRFELLKFLVDNYSNRDHFSIISVMNDKYGSLVFNRPDYDKLSGEIEAQLKLLAETDELKEVRGDFMVTGKAWSAVSDYQETDRRVSVGNKIQTLLVLLTLFLVILTAGQAGIIKFPTLLDLRSVADKVCETT